MSSTSQMAKNWLMKSSRIENHERKDRMMSCCYFGTKIG